MLLKNRFIAVFGIIFPVFAVFIGGWSLYAQTDSQSAGSRTINPVLTMLEHPWGHFQPQSWVRLQSVTWTDHNGRRIANFRETKTTLQSVDANGVVLQDISTVDMAGKQVENAPIVRRYDFFQQLIQDEVQVRIRNGQPTKLVVDKRVIPCEVRIYEQSTPAGKRKIIVWYSTQIYPYIFRIENILRSQPSDKEPKERILDMTITEVLESSAFHLRQCKRGTYRLRTTQKSGNVTSVTEAACSLHIPGGVIQKTTREFEGNGNTTREIRVVETRLINYYYGIPPIDADNATNTLDLPPSAPNTLYYSPEPIRPRWRRFYVAPSSPYPL
jgi:hypothetical protein